MKVRILASASRDLLGGYGFYERQSKGIGEYFLDTLYSDIDSLVVTAGIHPTHFGHYHRLLSKRFPFAVYYRIEDQTALVYAVLDCRRSPAWTRDRFA
ncbi:MAG: type II toxin-antitoxin system RelE/ParE family toxin [Gammaproteobacteria bacterium]